MAIAEFVAQLGEHFEELLIAHLLVDAHSIVGVDLLLVEPISLLLIVEKAIALVEQLPKGLEIAALGVDRNIFRDAARKEEHTEQQEAKRMFHHIE